MYKKYLVITSIATSENAALREYARYAGKNGTGFIVIGDTKSPDDFSIEGCDFYSVERQAALPYEIAQLLPVRHYARKNIGYIIAARAGAEVIIETDDDNLPYPSFWASRERYQSASVMRECGWLNVYRYFTDVNVWPRGFSLSAICKAIPPLSEITAAVDCPVQQGLADDNPDVDAMFRLTTAEAIKFRSRSPLALGSGSICPFNSQNTTWFREAFVLMYLPSYCSFRMTDIWRSFVAQRICHANGWNVLFHAATVWQERNDHNLMRDFEDEIPGYLNNDAIVSALAGLDLPAGRLRLGENLLLCYKRLVEMGLIDAKEIALIEAWINDIG